MTDANGPKCSTFAHDMMVENRMNPTTERLYAGIWGTKTSQIAGWSVVTDGTIMMGDIAAYAERTSDGSTGHMGIMSWSSRHGNVIIYAGSSDTPNKIAANILWTGKPWVIWRYTGR